MSCLAVDRLGSYPIAAEDISSAGIVETNSVESAVDLVNVISVASNSPSPLARPSRALASRLGYRCHCVDSGASVVRVRDGNRTEVKSVSGKAREGFPLFVLGQNRIRAPSPG